MLRTSMGLSGLPFALAVFGLAGAAAAHSEYQEHFAQASAHEAVGRFADAIDELESLRTAYPDDYALVLQLAWLRYRAGDYAGAAADYRRAAGISRGSQESRLGLAWCLLQQGSTGEAAALFRSILEASPDQESARLGLRIAEGQQPLSDWPTSSARGDFAWVGYHDHPVRDSAWSLAAGFGRVAADVVAWDVTYRFSRFQGRGEMGSSGNSQGRSWDQHEFYGLLGYTRPRYGVNAHFAYVRDEGEFDDDLFAVGLSGWLSTTGRLWVETSLSFYPDGRIFRLAPSWRIPLGGPFYVEPGGGLQVTNDRGVLGNGTIELGLDSVRGSLRIGGKYGREQRPLYLHLPLMLNLRDEVRWGFWAGAAVRFLGTGELRLTYELSRIDPVSSSADANMNVVAVSVRGSF